MSSNDQHMPLVSVIIPCYNHAHYLREAVESVLAQSYANIEIIIVNDGSTDETESIANSWVDVKYFFQKNQGLSAARNTGIEHSQGEFLAFLDADDYYHPDALMVNVRYLKENPSAAFVSGAHNKVSDDKKILEAERPSIKADHYLHLLQGNYIGMHATVLYRKKIFDEFRFDTTLNACEDYDLYLKIARKYPVIHHDQLIADYRIHGDNMSSDIPKMLNAVLKVLDRQQDHLKDSKEKEAFELGHKIWKEYYNDLSKKDQVDFSGSQRTTSMFKNLIKKISPSFLLRFAHKMGVYKSYRPPIGKIVRGDLESVAPFSTEFGFDRGGPVDRYYIENFLKKYSSDIKGRVLEIGDNEYTVMFGGNKVEKSDILHVEERNAKATFIADLSNAPNLPDNSFDCIILTQTLHLIYDFHAAIATCYRILKEGGVLLMTTPGITSIDQDEWNSKWYWSFTINSIRKILQKNFDSEKIEIVSYGNVYAATSFLYGMGLPEVSKEKLDFKDRYYEVIITARVVK
ncbi:MAG TPA: glycosyltransferase [Chitinophagaceae bacterium]|nr:glycosyltransferase [Chitinophagaceae bacterium]